MKPRTSSRMSTSSVSSVSSVSSTSARDVRVVDAASGPVSEAPATKLSKGVDRFSASFHRTRTERDALPIASLVPITWSGKDLARDTLKRVSRVRRAAMDARPAGLDGVLDRLETCANAVLYAQRRTEVSAPAALAETYLKACHLRDYLADELEPLLKRDLLDRSTLADVTSERGYAIVATQLLVMAGRAHAEWSAIEEHTLLGLDEVEDAFTTAQLLTLLHRQNERIDQCLLAARLDLRRALTVLVNASREAYPTSLLAARATDDDALVLEPVTRIDPFAEDRMQAAKATPPSSKPVPTPPVTMHAIVSIEDDGPADTVRTPPVAMLEETMKKAA